MTPWFGRGIYVTDVKADCCNSLIRLIGIDLKRKCRMAKKSNDTIYSYPDAVEQDHLHVNERAELLALIREGSEKKSETTVLEAELKQIKERLKVLINENGLVNPAGQFGARDGKRAVFLKWNTGRKSFSRELAVEQGIAPDVIDACFKEGDGYYALEFGLAEDE